jgi:hypothetical protein
MNFSKSVMHNHGALPSPKDPKDTQPGQIDGRKTAAAHCPPQPGSGACADHPSKKQAFAVLERDIKAKEEQPTHDEIFRMISKNMSS